MRMEGSQFVSYPSFTDQPVALIIASPPLTRYSPRLNNPSIKPTPDSPNVPFLNVAACISPQFHLDGSFPNIFSSSATPSPKDFFRISSRVSTLSVVDLSSHQALDASKWRITSFQREPPSGQYCFGSSSLNVF